ncbi:hypothetical protein D9M71_716730 [compost metagenome]
MSVIIFVVPVVNPIRRIAREIINSEFVRNEAVYWESSRFTRSRKVSVVIQATVVGGEREKLTAIAGRIFPLCLSG